MAELDEGERRALYGAITGGIHHARLVALNLPFDEGEQERDVVQVLTCLSTAIARLQAVRAMLQRRA